MATAASASTPSADDTSAGVTTVGPMRHSSELGAASIAPMCRLTTVNLVINVKRMVDLAPSQEDGNAVRGSLREDNRRVGSSRWVRNSAGVDVEAGPLGRRARREGPARAWRAWRLQCGPARPGWG